MFASSGGITSTLTPEQLEIMSMAMNTNLNISGDYETDPFCNLTT